MELDSSTPQTYWSLGYVYLMRKEFELAEKAVAQALDIAPNFADGCGLLALQQGINTPPILSVFCLCLRYSTVRQIFLLGLYDCHEDR